MLLLLHENKEDGFVCMCVCVSPLIIQLEHFNWNFFLFSDFVLWQLLAKYALRKIGKRKKREHRKIKKNYEENFKSTLNKPSMKPITYKRKKMKKKLVELLILKCVSLTHYAWHSGRNINCITLRLMASQEAVCRLNASFQLGK